MKPLDISNQTAVITGATGGLGSLLARDLAGQGVKLALIGRDQAKLDRLGSELALPEQQYMTYAADLTSCKAAAQAGEMIQAKFGPAGIVLHLVGGWTGGKTLAQLPAADLEEMVAQHVWTTFNVIQTFVPPMIESGQGKLVIVSSPSAVQPKAKGGAYAAAKAAQEAMFLTLAQEVAGSGVTANIIQVRNIDVDRKKIHQPSRENASWSTPEEICAAVFYLISEEGSAVNGARIPLYGGFL